MRVRFFWATLVVCIAGCTPSSTESVEVLFTRAEAHREAGDTMRAYRLYRRAAEAGSWQAQHMLGDFYRLGGFSSTDSSLADTYIRFVAKRLDKSETWYRRAVLTVHQAADLGDPEAQFALGTMYMNGFPRGRGPKVIEKDQAMAKQWIMRAAEQDYARALYILGMPFIKWFEPEEAYGLLERAVALGYADAYGMMALYHYRGVFTDGAPDYIQYVGLLKQGAEQGSIPMEKRLDEFLDEMARSSADGSEEARQILDDLETAGLIGS
jgi:TPR repeat protein